jgi:alpha-mannosidase
MASPEVFFESIQERGRTLPIVQDELQHHASGCYAAHSGIKQLNQLAENRLLAAEKWSTLAWLFTGLPYPANLERGWKDVLFNQFHDIMAGTSLEVAYEDARNELGEALAIADRALNLAIQSFAWNIDIPAVTDTQPVIVFNPHAWPVKANVEVEFGAYHNEILLDDTGEQVPLQRVQSLATTVGRNRLSFIADVPPLGYRVYHAATRPSVKEFPVIETSKNVLDGPDYRLEIDPETGAIASLRDKRNNVDVFLGQAALPVVIQDPSDTWSHDVFRFDRVIGQFEAKSVKLAEHGPVKSVLRVTSEYCNSRLVQDFTMYPELDRIDVFVTMDWREQFKLLKLRFPVNVRHMRVTYEIPYGSIERNASGDEEPMQSWVDVSGTARDADIPYGFSLLSPGKYSVDVNVRDIGLTVLRSPIYAHHVPAVPEEGRLYSFQDQGIQRFRYTLYPHRGSWESASTFRRAAEMREPLVGLVGTYHRGAGLPQRDSFVMVEPDNMIVPAIKKAEDSDDLIVRVVETTKAATLATVQFPRLNRTIQAEFAPGEIKTFLVPRDPAKPVVETDLIERPLA